MFFFAKYLQIFSLLSSMPNILVSLQQHVVGFLQHIVGDPLDIFIVFWGHHIPVGLDAIIDMIDDDRGPVEVL